MSLKPYPKYKDSGVEWLGEIPEEWTTLKLKRIASLQSGEFITAERIKEAGPFPVYGGNGLRGYTSDFTHDGSYALIGRQGALCGNINYATEKFWASEHAVVATPTRKVDTIWLGEMLRAMNLNQYSLSAAQPGLSVELISNLRIPFPSNSEQIKISQFLRRETAKIDALIAEQEKLITLLAEKRQVTISHAVTKGLNPNAKMKDSGVEWLGAVPEHWEVKRLKHLIGGVESGVSVNAADVPAVGDEFGVLKTSCVYDGEFRVDENKTVVPEERGRVSCPVKANTLIVSRMNTPDLVGAIGLTRQSYSNIFLPDRLWQISLPQRLPELVHYWSKTRLYRSQVEAVCTGTSSSMQNLSQSQFGDFVVAVPCDADEQQEIITFLERESRKLDSLTVEANRLIELLRERRTALISAAVTGKIDVRGIVEAESAAA